MTHSHSMTHSMTHVHSMTQKGKTSVEPCGRRECDYRRFETTVYVVSGEFFANKFSQTIFRKQLFAKHFIVKNKFAIVHIFRKYSA